MMLTLPPPLLVLRTRLQAPAQHAQQHGVGQCRLRCPLAHPVKHNFHRPSVVAVVVLSQRRLCLGLHEPCGCMWGAAQSSECWQDAVCLATCCCACWDAAAGGPCCTHRDRPQPPCPQRLPRSQHGVLRPPRTSRPAPAAAPSTILSRPSSLSLLLTSSQFCQAHGIGVITAGKTSFEK